MAQFFISHSSKDNFAAIALRDWIIAGGWDDHPFLDLDPERGIAAGQRWERALHEAADQCEVVLFLVSRNWLKSDWCLKEFNLAQKLNKRLFGVLIDDLPHSDLPATLTANWQVVNLASGSDHDLFRVTLPDLSNEEHVTFSRSGLACLKAGLDKAGLDPRYFEWPPKDDPDRSPYPGLRPLDFEDAGIFFGREAPTVLALDRLRGLREAAPPRLLVIQGASGAGKSSFLRAGLIPRLKRDEAHFLPLPIIRPERAVISGATGLIHTIEEAFKAQRQPLNRAEIAEAIRRGVSKLLTLLARLSDKARGPSLDGVEPGIPPSLVLSIDQGEELFLAEGAEEAHAFLALLREFALAGAPNIIILLTIRSDSYERLQMAKELEDVRQETFPLPPMPRGAFQTIIEAPAQQLQRGKRKLKLDPALTAQVLKDIEEGGGKDALPLLAFTLERLYREYGSDGDLRLDEYQRLGGIGGSIEAAVKNALKAADSDPTIPKDPNERLALLRKAMIPALAVVDPDTRTPRRRAARLSEIPPETRGLVDCLTEARLLTTDEVTENGKKEIVIEPAHEALLRQWGELQEWLNEDTSALLALGGLQQAARDWEAHDKSDDWLTHSAGRLEDAERLHEFEDFSRFITPIEQAYLQTCRRAETTRRNVLTLSLGAGLVVALALAGIAFWQRNIALEQTKIATKNSSTTLVALSNLALLRNEPADAVRLALAAWPREGDDRPQMRRTIAALSAALPHQHEIWRLHVHGGLIGSAFSSDWANMVTVSNNKTVRICDAKTGTMLKELTGHNGAINSAAFSPDGARVVTASNDGTTRVWDAKTGATLVKWGAPGDVVRSAAFSPDGKRIVSASHKMAYIWDATTGVHLQQLGGHTGLVVSVAFSPDGSRVATAEEGKGDGGTAVIWNASTGKVLEVLSHNEEVYSAAFSADGTRIVTASADRTARIWDAKTGQTRAVLRGHGGLVLSAAFSPDGARVVTASDDNTARIWDAQTGATLKELMGHDGAVDYAAFSPEGARVITASRDGTARVWNANLPTMLKELKGHGNLNSATFTSDGARVVTASDDGTVRVRDASTGATLRELKVRGGPACSAAISSDGARVVASSCDIDFTDDDRTARIWDVKNGATLSELKGHGDLNSAALRPDGARVVTVSGDIARIWDVETGAVLQELKGHGGRVISAAFSPDGARVVTASHDKTARIWDAQTGAILMELKGVAGAVFSAAFSPNGTRVVTASSDNTTRIWDASTGATVEELKGHGGALLSAAFSPDGTRIVTASNDGGIRIWDVSTLVKVDAFAIACMRLGKDTNLTELADLVKRYGLVELNPVCGDHPPTPVDRSKVVD